MTVLRIDAGRLGKARLDANGFLIASGTLSRVGVFTYKHSDGRITREARFPEDILAPAAVESFINVPLTLNHPPGAVTPDNAKRYTVGNTSDTVDFSDGETLKTVLVIRDRAAIDAVLGKDGRAPVRMLSCGYRAEVVPEKGVFRMPGHQDDGQPYDHRQTQVVGNHVALVRAGRAGPVATLQLDSADGIQADHNDDGLVEAWLSANPASLPKVSREWDGVERRKAETGHQDTASSDPDLLRIAQQVLHLDAGALAELPVHAVQRAVLRQAMPNLRIPDDADELWLLGAWRAIWPSLQRADRSQSSNSKRKDTNMTQATGPSRQEIFMQHQRRWSRMDDAALERDLADMADEMDLHGYNPPNPLAPLIAPSINSRADVRHRSVRQDDVPPTYAEVAAEQSANAWKK